jgi:hypothetical protein
LEGRNLLASQQSHSCVGWRVPFRGTWHDVPWLGQRQ